MNQVIIIGKLTKDPELKYAQNGNAIANFTVAVDRNYSKDKKAELKSKGQPTADFIRVIAWGKTAELCANYLAKGKQVAVNGSIQTSTYKSNTGETRYSTDVLANNVEFLGSAESKPKEETYNADDFMEIDEDMEKCPF